MDKLSIVRVGLVLVLVNQLLPSINLVVRADNPIVEEIRKKLQAAQKRRKKLAMREYENVLKTLTPEKRVKYLEKWAQPEFDRRLQARPLSRVGKRNFEKWKTQRDVMLDRIIHFPDKSHGMIAKGGALNRLVEACGATAIIRLHRRKVGDEVVLQIPQGELLNPTLIKEV